MYPRDPNRDYQFQGRVRVQMKNDDGTFCNENFTSRKPNLIIFIFNLTQICCRAIVLVLFGRNDSEIEDEATTKRIDGAIGNVAAAATESRCA